MSLSLLLPPTLGQIWLTGQILDLESWADPRGWSRGSLGGRIHDSQAPVFKSLYCRIQLPRVGIQPFDLQTERGVGEDPGQQDIDALPDSIIFSQFSPKFSSQGWLRPNMIRVCLMV